MADLSGLAPPPPKKRRPKSKPERIDEIITRATQGDDFERLISNLSAEEQALFWEQIAILRRDGALDLDDLWKIDYHRTPPTIEQFIEDDYWVGAVCRKTSESTGLFTSWREMLVSDFDLDSRIHNVVLTGSLGTGKSMISTLLLLYRIALARCMRNPQSFLGLAKGSAILYVMLSVTRASVTETVWGDAKNFMSNSPFFIEECRFNPGKKYASLHIALGGNIFLTAGSRGQHILGRNTMGVLLDEGNWRLEANPDVKAYDLYNDVRTRLSNRFQKIDGYLPALSILASSARDESSVTENVIEEIKASNRPANERVYRFAVFRIRRDEIRLGTRWFKVEHAMKNQEPKVLSGFYTEDSKPITVEGLVHEGQTEGSQIELVPERYLEEFKRNPKIALQSVCGISTGGTHRLFSSMEHVEKAIKSGVVAGLVDPCRMPLIAISDDDKRQVWDYLNHPSFLTRRAGRIIPLRDPEAMRYAHLDLATTNVAGLSICHAVGTKLIENLYNRETGATFNQYRRVVAYDFMLAITAGQSKPISVKKIQDFLFWLRDYCGFRYGKISCDSYGAGIPLQPFDARGIPTEILSMDKNKIPYYSWRSGFEEDRILMFSHPILLREAEYLVDNPTGKIDHPEKTPYGPGSKDLTDSAGGCYYTCINDESKSAGNVSPSDVTLYTGQETSSEPPLITIMPTPEIRPIRKYTV